MFFKNRTLNVGSFEKRVPKTIERGLANSWHWTWKQYIEKHEMSILVSSIHQQGATNKYRIEMFAVPTQLKESPQQRENNVN